MDVVFWCFTEKWWDWERSGFAGRTAALALGLSRHPAVRRMLVVDAPSSVARRLTGRDDGRGSATRSGLPGVRQAAESVFVLDQLRLAPRDRHSPVAARMNAVLHDRALAESVRAAAAGLHMTAPVAWLAGPTVARYAQAVRPAAVAYDAVDEWLAHPAYSPMRGAIARGYARIAREADLVFAVTPHLAARFEGARPRVVVLPNAAPARAEPKAPHQALSAVPGPRVGYVGVLQGRIDAELIVAVARRMPNVSFVFVGPVLDIAHVARLRALGNVHLLGACGPDEVASYLTGFDVCMLPHVDSELTRNMDPVKLYEYVAAGKPVVATDLPGLTQPRGLVRRAAGPAEWASAIDAALAGTWRPPAAETAAYADANTWEARVDRAVAELSAASAGAAETAGVAGRWAT